MLENTYVILKKGTKAGEKIRDEIKHHVREMFGKPFVPREVHFVGELPKTRSAKILRRLIRAIAAGEDTGDISSLDNPQALKEIQHVSNCFIDVSPSFFFLFSLYVNRYASL